HKILRENMDFLPGVHIPEEIEITSKLSNAVKNREVIVIAVPSHVVREVCTKLNALKIGNRFLIVNVAKGIENNSLKRMSEIILETIDGIKSESVATLSGPSHAEEVSKGIPTAAVSSSASLETSKKVQQIFFSSTFRIYTNTDIIGVELGGSLKNTIAIAAGICDGAGFGDNTKAALLTRGLYEITKLGIKMGAKKETFAGLSGMGDLIVTCLSKHSRNRYVGEQIGKGKKLEEVLSSMKMVAEGVKTTISIYQLSKIHNVEMPISLEVYRVLFENKNPIYAVSDLMERDPGPEILIDLGIACNK
ncbi:MAG: NAD(P)H-dependent glycerol-3-phosphate dehydrogenase, partial [Fidelibacterota bacterium]